MKKPEPVSQLGLGACVPSGAARRLLDGEPGARVELFAVAARRSDPSSGRPAVFHGVAGDRDLRAGCEVAAANAGACKRARTFGLESPRRDVALVVFDVDKKPRMRVRVL